MTKHIKVDKKALLDGLKTIHEARTTFNDEEYNFLVSLIENLEDLQKDASRYRMWKKLLEDPHLIKEVESILDRHIKQV